MSLKLGPIVELLMQGIALENHSLDFLRPYNTTTLTTLADTNPATKALLILLNRKC
jgi:hypothetical protein